MDPAAFVACFVVAVGFLIVFVHVFWLAIGLTVLALPGRMLLELFTDVRYSTYRREWEIASEKEVDSL
jgi:hypothetical protein